ncbi:hypothetical protein GCM10027597_01770 [Saccharopolyspora tripterygii]
MPTRRPLTNPPTAPTARSPQRRWRACCRGELPAEALSTRDREDLVAELHTRGWTDAQIALHTRMSLYTTARIRDRIGRDPNPEQARQQ